MTWVISRIAINGVKGVLDRAGEFQLLSKKKRPKSVAIFGRNGHGKSGYADAVEYLFSTDGSVEHLGKGSADSEQGGRHAIPHVLAEELGITPQITADFYNLDTREKLSTTRLVTTGRGDSRPADIDLVTGLSPAHRILRQHDLRRFVVEMTPGQKFEEFARWIGLDRLVVLLKHLTTVDRTLKETSVDREITERLKSIETHTGGAVTQYDRKAILQWCADEVLKTCAAPWTGASAADLDGAVSLLRDRREALILGSKVAQREGARTAIKAVAAELADPNGPLASIRHRMADIQTAEVAILAARHRAAESVFEEVWRSSVNVLEQQTTSACPTCGTSWKDTQAGSQGEAVIRIRKSLGALSELEKLNAALAQRNREFKSSLRTLVQTLGRLADLGKQAGAQPFEEAAQSLAAEFGRTDRDERPVGDRAAEIEDALRRTETLAKSGVLELLSQEQAGEYGLETQVIDTLTARLRGLQETLQRLETLTLEQDAIGLVEAQFNTIADEIREKTNVVANNAVMALRQDVLRIYRKIHPGETVPDIFVKLNTDDKTLSIRVNFHSNERTVPPGGYLSEAQINTLGLALFLSAVRLFNRDFPFVFLDDIVSSYDADSRARIVDVLAEDMAGFQIILTTHDERFFTLLKSRLESNDWYFERITGYDFAQGPRRESDALKPEQIDELLRSSNERIAGNAARQYIEEWLDAACERYCVYTLHHRGVKEHKRTLFEYWPPFVKRIRDLKGDAGSRLKSAVVLDRLESSLLPIVNYYSHNQTNPYEWGAMGDVRYVWESFTAFTSQLDCFSCGRPLDYDFDTSRLYCTCGGSIVDPDLP